MSGGEDTPRYMIYVVLPMTPTARRWYVTVVPSKQNNNSGHLIELLAGHTLKLGGGINCIRPHSSKDSIEIMVRVNQSHGRFFSRVSGMNNSGGRNPPITYCTHHGITYRFIPSGG